MDLIRKAIADAAPSFNDGAMSVSGWLSCPTVDTDDEVIDGTAFDLDSMHRKFPVLLWAHRRDVKPIGSWSDSNGNYTLKARAYPGGGHGLYGTAFFSKANPEGEVIYGMYREGMLKGFSAGFLSRKSVQEKIGGKVCKRFTAATLAEGSAVPMPANPDAVAVMVSKAAKVSPWLAADLSALLPRKILVPCLMTPAKQSRKTLKGVAMATETQTEVVETPEVVTKAAHDELTGKLDTAVKSLNEAIDAVNTLNDTVAKQAAEIETLKGVKNVLREEYDADMGKVADAIGTVAAKVGLEKK